MKIFANTLILLVLWSISANCQEVTITGELLDFESNEPMQGVTIIESHTMNGITSDSLGKFQLHLTQNNTKIEFHFVGYYQLELVNVSSIKELETLKIKMVRDYSKCINVDFGFTDIKPDLKKHKQIEMEVLNKYRLSYNGDFLEPIISGDKIVFDLKNN
jgi:hypothetical protein